MNTRLCLLPCLLAATLLAACSPARTPRALGEFSAPVQTALTSPVEPVMLEDGVWAVPRARYEVEAYVLATREYRRQSRADIAPVDFALGWGVVVQPQNVHRVRVTQKNREHNWEVSDATLLQQVGPRAFDLGIANTHMIPANGQIQDLLLDTSPGDAVRAAGYLVDVRTRESSDYRRTSIRRDDKGPRSGELFYVTSLEVLAPGY